MRVRGFAILLVSLSLGSGCEGEPDYVAETQEVACDPASQLVRRGYPENLQALFVVGNCRAERSRTMRGPDYTFWLAGQRASSTDCSNPANWFWTEEAADGTITAVNFCPGYCARLRERLLWELTQDVECPPHIGTGMAGAPAAGMMMAAGGAGAPAPQP